MSYSDLSIMDIASKTEGYVYHDMETLMDRAIHVAIMARMQQTPCNYELCFMAFTAVYYIITHYQNE